MTSRPTRPIRKPIPRQTRRRLPLALMGVLASCSSSPWRAYRYEPSPLETQISSEQLPQATVRALVSVVGIARDSDEVVVKLRLENLGNRAARLDEAQLSLVSADLVAFGSANVRPVPVTLERGKGETYELTFAPPEQGIGKIDLHGLNLRFAVDFDGTLVTAGATFHLDEWRTYAESPRVQFGVGWWHWD